MTIGKEYQLFLVEFGKPDMSNYFNFGSQQAPMFVIAKSYDEAANKAMNELEINPPISNSKFDQQVYPTV